MRLPISLLFVVMLAGCAAPITQSPMVSSAAAELEAKRQRELVVKAYQAHEDRLRRVAFRVLTHGTPMCGERVTKVLGLVAKNVYSVPEDWRQAARGAFGLTEAVHVASVTPGSPAAAAGLQTGDVIKAVGSWNAPVGEEAVPAVGKAIAEAVKGGSVVRLSVNRGGTSHTLSVSPVDACDYAAVVDRDEAKNAYADGERIIVTQGMMDFLRSDEELALIVSHELAHNAMGHITAQTTNAVAGGLAGLILDVAAAAAGVNTQGAFTDLGTKAGAGAYSVEFEQEADYVGIYFMTRAGYDTAGVADFWRRMAIQSPQSIAHRSTHPTAPERFIAIEKTVDEVAAKVAASKPLMPEIRVQAPSTPTVSDSDDR